MASYARLSLNEAVLSVIEYLFDYTRSTKCKHCCRQACFICLKDVTNDVFVTTKLGISICLLSEVIGSFQNFKIPIKL